MPYHVSKGQFAALVEKALSELPDPFAAAIESIPIEVRDRPSLRQLRDVGLKDDDLLLGLYHGRPLPQRSVEDSGRLPDLIYIFQQDIEMVCRSEAELVRQVRTTVLHEIGHHFGMNEEDLKRLGYG